MAYGLLGSTKQKQTIAVTTITIYDFRLIHGEQNAATLRTRTGN